jgi:alpha-L-fucosidase
VDIVSRNGNLLLNFPLPNNGMPDAEELKIVDEITKWMAVNSEAIYSTRPWKVYGSRAAMDTAAARGASEHHQAGAFNERNRKDLTAADVRYTKKGSTVFAFSMGWPERQAVFPELALGGAQQAGKIGRVQMLGFRGPVKWTQDSSALRVEMPPEKPCDHAIVLKVEGV